MPPEASRFSRTTTWPSIGALITRLSMFCWARVAAISALARFSSTSASAALLASARDVTSPSTCWSRRRGLLDGELTLRVLRCRDQVLVDRAVELGAADVEARGQQLDLVLRGLDRGVRLALDDFLLGLLELGLRLLERVDLLGRIELDQDVAGLDRRCPLARVSGCAACRRPTAPAASPTSRPAPLRWRSRSAPAARA